MIPRELLKKIRTIEIVTSRLAADQLVGRYQSVFKGKGISFSEVRAYLAGDDVRQIDWNVSARMNEPFVKLFTEEREMTVMLLVDMSASGRFGSVAQPKREVAAEVAALVAFSAIKNNDRVGLIIFTDRVELFVPPKKGKKHVLRVIMEILSYKPSSPRTDLGAGLEYLGRIARRRSVAFLVSDFLADGWGPALRVAVRRHDLVPVVLADPLEEALPALGIATFEDLESGELLELDLGGRERQGFRDEVKRRKREREELLRRLQVDVVNVRTDKPYVDAISAFFRARERRMRH